MGGLWSAAFLGPFLGLLVMVTIAYVLWSAFTGGNSEMQRSTSTDDAMETLRERYARGEIDEETFEARARRLRDR